MALVPNTRPARWPDIPPDRFARLIRSDSPEGCRVALLGLPDDLGVRLNQGRPGACVGPDAFRAALARFGCPFDARSDTALPAVVFDAGDVVPAPADTEPALRETHDRVSQAVLALHRAGLITVCVGGGHDLSFPAIRALASHAGGMVGGVSVDAHLDVRETAGSGMPFRALIDARHLDPRRFTVLGAGRFTNARRHVEYLRSRSASIVTIDEALEAARSADAALARAGAPAFVSIDLDAIDGSHAPGVSAVNPMGFDPRSVCEFARRAGASAGVRHFDLVELSPPHDEPPWDDTQRTPGRTARVAALLLLHFLSGLAERPAP